MMRMLRLRHGVVLSLLLLASWTVDTSGGSLKGSRDSMMLQNRMAHRHDYTFLRNPSHVHKFAKLGYIEKVEPNRDFELYQVSFPYARPALKLFIERLARQYRRATGEKLVVTSLTRPHSHQPHNSSSLSVHPTGMAVDLRISRNRSARRWLEKVLLDLEKEGVLEATKERRPPHYHVAVFPNQYESYVRALESRKARRSVTHKVARGDTLWELARRYDTSVGAIKRLNDLRSGDIRVGQVLRVR